MRVEIAQWERDALAALGAPAAMRIVAAFDLAKEAADRQQDAVALARAACPDDMDFDDQPAVSESAGAVWVAAWVRIPIGGTGAIAAPTGALPPDNITPIGIVCRT